MLKTRNERRMERKEAGKKAKERLGARLFDLALKLSKRPNGVTQAETSGLIKTMKMRKSKIDGSASIRTATLAVLEVAEQIDMLRRTRQPVRMGFVKPELSGDPGVPARSNFAMPGATPVAVRLARRVESVVTAAFLKSYTIPAGDAGISVRMTTDPESVSISTKTEKDWSQTYRGDYKNYAMNRLDVKIVVPQRYLSRVVKRGLAVVDGMMTLDAQPMDCAEVGVEVYRATWGTQGRGCSVKLQEGFIARADGESFHGKTYASAIQGLRRKLRYAEDPQGEIRRRAEASVKAFVARWRGQHFPVSVNDAYETGACEYGVRSWCHSNGLPFDDGEAPLAEVLEAYKRQPLPEARRAILHAARRHAGELMAA
jgi:hypothetical protein